MQTNQNNRRVAVLWGRRSGPVVQSPIKLTGLANFVAFQQGVLFTFFALQF